MAVGLKTPENLLPVKGVRLGVAQAGIRYADRDDLVLIELAEGTQTAAVFTRNAFCAAPVVVSRQHLSSATPAFLVINSGNANAGLGEAGMQAARDTCDAVAKLNACDPDQVLVFSTGVIGEPFATDKLVAGLPAAQANLDTDNWLPAAQAIMTTDTVAKGVSEQLSIDGQTVTITGMVKGAGMIRPDMATMLAYIATDANVAADVLDDMLTGAVADSFNRITVDGDTSTNDACVLMATGQAGNAAITEPASENACLLGAAIARVCQQLAEAMLRDAEGATRLMTIVVEQGEDEDECARVGFTIAHSPLVKTALFAGDPNWGRILAAIGRAGVDDLDIEGIEIMLDDVCIVRNGGRADSYTEEDGQRVMQQDVVTVTVRLGRGSATTTVKTCDFSYDYVRINAEYRS